jgi:RNA polymerase primary sigma factor
MSNVLNYYFKDVSRYDLLTREEEITLSQAIEKGDKLARDRMIQSNLRLAISIAKKYSKMGCPLEDLIQESNIGLMKAVDRFDWRRGFKFSTYASWWIKQSVSRHLTSHKSTVRVPAHASGLIWKIKKICREYEDEFRHQPTISEIADLLGVTESMIKLSLESAAIQNSISLDAALGDEKNGRRFEEIISDTDSESPDDLIDRQKTLNIIKNSLAKLSPREEKILRLRFGIYEDIEQDEVFNVEVQ